MNLVLLNNINNNNKKNFIQRHDWFCGSTGKELDVFTGLGFSVSFFIITLKREKEKKLVNGMN